jgi:hypothetical protein
MTTTCDHPGDMTMDSTHRYYITASCDRVDCSQPEILGDAAGRDYATLDDAIVAAEAVVDYVDSAIADGDIDASTTIYIYQRGNGVAPAWSSDE